jgi:hypothetical protein
MESLKALLTNEIFVRDAIAKQIYEIENPDEQKKYFVKLRDRALGNLRFQEEEVNALLKVFTALARKIDRKASKIRQAKATQKEIDLIKELEFPTINLKQILIRVGKQLPIDLADVPEEKQNNLLYQAVYDQLRERTTPSDQLIPLLTAELEQLAHFITTQLNHAREERKTYTFGRKYRKKDQDPDIQDHQQEENPAP